MHILEVCHAAACSTTRSLTIWKAPRRAPSWIFSDVPADKLYLERERERGGGGGVSEGGRIELLKISNT